MPGTIWKVTSRILIKTGVSLISKNRLIPKALLLPVLIVKIVSSNFYLQHLKKELFSLTIYSLVHVCLIMKSHLLIYLCYAHGSMGIREQCERLTSSLLFWKVQGLNWSQPALVARALSTEFPFWLNVFPFRMENRSTLPTQPQNLGIYKHFKLLWLFDLLWSLFNRIYLSNVLQLVECPGVHLNGTNKIPEPTMQDVTSLRDVGVTPHKNMLFQPRLWNELWRTNLWPGAQQPGSVYPRLGEAPLT